MPGIGLAYPSLTGADHFIPGLPLSGLRLPLPVTSQLRHQVDAKI
jgi:hypothetical protein